MASEYFIHLFILIGIYVILAQGLNITFGLGGSLNLAHIAVYAIGAYTTALLSTDLAQPVWICVPASIAFGSLCALPIGAIALRLKQDYFAIGTLAFSSVISALLINWKSLTRGVLGIAGIPRPEIAGMNLYENSIFISFELLLVLPVLLVWGFFRTPLARMVRAQAESEECLAALGVEPSLVRRDAFVLSSMLAGLAGSLFAYYLNYIDPSSFSFAEMVFVLSILIVGRPGSYFGIIGASAFLVLLPEPLRFIGMPSSILGPARQLLQALILLAVLYYRREALFPKLRTV